MATQRDVRFDVLRSLVMLNAIAIHCHIEFDLGKPALVFQMLQGGVFSVGGFFFFTGGYMAQRVYLPRFQIQPGRLSRRLVQKGLSILGIYGVFLAVMYGLTGLALPEHWLPAIFQERFYTEVLLTFGLLFLLIPPLLWLQTHWRWSMVAMLVGCGLGFVLYPQLPIHWLWLDYLCDRTVTLYPLLTALITFAAGFLFAQWDGKTQAAERLRWQAIALTLIVVHLLVLGSSKTYLGWIVAQPFYTFFESVTPYLAIAALSLVFKLSWVGKLLTWPPFLALGIESLLTFILANGLIVLLPIPTESSMVVKWVVLLGLWVGVGAIAYGKRQLRRDRLKRAA